MQPIFITGTDTNIGKTTISMWLMKISDYFYWKPIQTGQDSDTETIKNITLIEDYRFIKPVYYFSKSASPHIASQKQNITISLNKIITEMPKKKNLIIEGAGGVMVPINKQEMIIDLIKNLNSRTIIVAKTLLGTINHTLLTIKALKDYDINIAGVILNGEINHDVANSIKEYGNIKILAYMPTLLNFSSKEISNIKINKSIKELFNEL